MALVVGAKGQIVISKSIKNMTMTEIRDVIL